MDAASCSFTRIAVGVALLILSLGSARAACPGPLTAGTYEISTAQTARCEIGPGQSVEVKAGGSITLTNYAPAIEAPMYGPSAGSITNAGQLSADIGIQADADVTTITNAAGGVIRSSGGTAISVQNAQAVANHGLILAEGVGIDVLSTIGSLTNTGTIAAAEEGLLLEGATVLGDIVNSGSIASTNSAGVYFDYTGATVSGRLVNRGTITGTYGLWLQRGATIAGGIVNTGRIEGGSYGVFLASATLGGGIVNDGTITNTGSAGDALMLSKSSITGGIVNSAAGVIRAGLGNGLGLDQTTVGGGISNAGTIAGGAGGDGLYFDRSTLQGGLLNTGTITGANGLMLYGGTLSDGNIVNTGTLSGTGASGVGLGVGVGGVFTFGNAGSRIVNSGLITGARYALQIDPTIAVIVENTGTLQGGVRLGGASLHLMGDGARVVGDTVGHEVQVLGRFASEGGFVTDSFVIGSGGQFQMNHDVTATTFSNLGTLSIAAGGAPHVRGDYLQAAGGTFETQLAGATQYGRLQVDGNVTLADGARVRVNVLGTPRLYAGMVMPGVLQAGGTLSVGTPSISDNSFLYDFGVSTARNARELDLVVVAANAVLKATREQGNAPGAGAAAVLDGFIATGAPAPLEGLVDALGRLSSAQQVSDAVRQLLPAHAGGGARATNDMLHGLHRIIQARTEGDIGLSAGDEVAGGGHLWIKPFASTGSQSTRRGVDGFDARNHGFVLGLDRGTGERSRLGAAFAYAESRVRADSSVAPQRTDIDSYALIGYGSYQLDPATELNWQADAAHHRNEGVRAVPLFGLAAAARYGARTLHAGVGAGRLLQLSSATSLSPSVRLDYTQVSTRGYTESGAGGLNLAVSRSRFDELLLSADAKLVHQISAGTRLAANAALGYDFKSQPAMAVSSFVGGGPGFVTQGFDPSPWWVRVGAGLVTTWSRDDELTLRYDAEARPSGYRSQTLSLRWRRAF